MSSLRLERDVAPISKRRSLTTKMAYANAGDGKAGKFALLEGIASDWWWEMDEDHRFVFVSDRFTEVFGLPASAIIGKRRTDLDRSDYGNAAWQGHLDDLARRRSFRDFETTFVDAAGAARPVRISGVPVFAADGNFQGYVGVGHDLTDLRQHQQEIVELFDNLTSIMENVDQGVALLDPELRIVACNNRFAELLQVGKAMLPSSASFEEIVSRLACAEEHGSGEIAVKAAAQLAQIRSRSKQVVEYKRPDDRIVSVVSTPIAAGGTVLMLSDVTELREGEARLRQREESYRHLFVHSPFPKWVYNAQTLRFLEVNDAAIAKYGYTREEFLSMNLRDIRPPEDIARLEELLTKPSAERRHVKGWKHRCKDGSLLNVDIFTRDLEFDGQAARIATVVDNTARYEAESLAQRFFETSQDIIFVSDENRRFVRVSPSAADLLGYQPEEMIGRHTYDFIYPEDLDVVAERVRATRGGEDVLNFRCRYVHKAGHAVPLMWTGRWSEVDRRFFFIGRDMTDFDRAQAQLHQAQKMEAVGQLTGGVAHDFNNILMVVQARLEVIEEDHPHDRGLLDDVKVITGATQRAAELTGQLLAFSRKQALRPQPANINDLIAQTGKLLKRSLGAHVELDAILSEDLWAVEVDYAQFEAALVNLCINARDAMPNGGRLLIESRNIARDDSCTLLHPDMVTGDHVLVSVTDTGTGIPVDLLEKVLEPFFTTKGVGKGTGLGLSMVYGFIKQSKGHIKIHSDVGKGTTINIYLPRYSGENGRASASTTSEACGGSERILVVEDEANVRASVVRQLKGLGYQVEEASDGDAGLAAFAVSSVPFDLLLTDVVMPGALSGKTLADEAVRRWPATKVVFMSGYSDTALIHDGRMDAGVRLLSKPFRKADLARTIREALDAVT